MNLTRAPIPATTDAIKRWVHASENWLSGYLKDVPASIVAIVAMGSAVRNRGHRRSDLDLLMLYEGTRPTIDAPPEIDVRSYPIALVEREIALGHEVICWAAKFGRPVYDPFDQWACLLANIQAIPLPSEMEAIERGKRSLDRAKQMLGMGDLFAADDLVLAAATQMARAQLIRRGIFPASRPELPDQLQAADGRDPLASILNDAMFAACPPSELVQRLDGLNANCERAQPVNF